jgi:uncharacterized protein (DUF2141 family)
MFLKIFGVMLISLFSIMHKSNENKNCFVEVSISNLRNDKGELLIAVYDKADGFPNDQKKIYLSKKLPINDVKLFKFTIPLPKNGTYAIAVVHDENKNEKLDTNFFGVPTEGYGFSNNKTGVFGAPSFKDCAFSISNADTHQLEIQIKYW